MLLGEYRHSLDGKGRVFLPARWRGELGEDVIVSQGLDRCLYVMTPPKFEEFSRRLNALGVEQSDVRAYARILFSQSYEEGVDGQGRITIPPQLRTKLNLTKDLVLAGASWRGEVWDRSLYDAYQGGVQPRYEEIAEKLQF